MSAARAPAEALWHSLRLPADALPRLRLTERPDPAVNSSFKLGTATQTAIGLSGLAAAEFHRLRTGIEQDVTVDARHAVLECKSEAYYSIDGDDGQKFALFDELAGVYRTKDNSYVRIHTNFPHHKQAILDILGCEPSRASIAEAMLQWNAVEFETEAANRKAVATALRSFSDWDAHPQGLALADTPPVMLLKVSADAPKRNVAGQPTRPLEGIRVLDLTRVLAGPVCGRTLAAHGADVLWITSPKLPALPNLDVDTSRGKRTTHLDLDDSTDRETFASLVKDADVFLQAYRPGGLAGKGFGVEDVVSMRPGLVYASLCAYGWEGPWRSRRGFDSLVQTATGFNVAEAETYAAYTGDNDAPRPLPPKPLPMQALDHVAGYMLAYGIQAALHKTVTEGGSWEVRVSLAAVGRWIRSLGQLDPVVAFNDGPPLPPRSMEDPEVSRFAVKVKQVKGDKASSEQRTMTAVGHAAKLSATPVREGEAPMRLDAHAAEWLPRLG
ncbi:CoA-transferase family III [Trametes sanguinea]|nr:CoA-transferase family III [Trametes sanguinea]